MGSYNLLSCLCAKIVSRVLERDIPVCCLRASAAKYVAERVECVSRMEV